MVQVTLLIKRLECAITENATVLCSKHEYNDVINEQLSTLPLEVIESHTSDSDCSGAPLNKFQVAKLHQQKCTSTSFGAKVWRLSSDYQKYWCYQWYYWDVENINSVDIRCLKDNELMCITCIKHYVSMLQSLPLRNSSL